MDPLTLTQIDDLCTQFEENWTPHSFDEIGELAGSGQFADDSSFFDLFCELVQIDLEKRWIHKLREINKISAKDLGSVISDLRLPSIQDYLNLKGAEHVSSDEVDQLMDCERKCHLRYGDAGVSRKDVTNSQAIDFLPTAKVRSGDGTACSQQLAFFSPLEIGRQSRDEPEPVCMTNAFHGKLIIAEGSNCMISRHQLTVTVVAGTIATVDNNSRNRHFLIEEHGVVAPDESAAVRFPFTISLDPVFIDFRRRSKC